MDKGGVFWNRGVQVTPPRASEMSPVRLVLAICLFATFHLSAQPKAVASLQPERIETGDTTTLLLLVSGMNAEPKDVDFSPWASVFPITNIIRRTEWKRSGTQWTRRFTLIAFDSARLELPPVLVRQAAGAPLETNALQLTVFPTRGGRDISDMAKIRDIRREPEDWTDYWPWGAGALAIIVLVLWWARSRRNRPLPVAIQSVPVAIPVSPAEKALQQLSQLEQKQLWRKDQIKEHYAELSLILREYLENRYGIAALESTTAEIQKMIAGTDFPSEQRGALKELLQKADSVKYAQFQPSETLHEAVLSNARTLITPGQTKKQAPVKNSGIPPAASVPKTGKYEPL